MLIDEDKLRIRLLDDRSGCALWVIWVMARTDVIGHSDAIEFSMSSTTSEGSKRQASDIIVNALSDQALRLMRTRIKK